MTTTLLSTIEKYKRGELNKFETDDLTNRLCSLYLKQDPSFISEFYELLFELLVARDVRGECSSTERAIIENDIRRWLNELNSLKRDVEIQLTAQKARMTRKQAECLEGGNKVDWLNYKAQEEEWKIRSIRFMVSVEEKIMSVKTLRAEMNSPQELAIAS